MRFMRLVAVILAVLVGLTSCSRDPNVVKKRYYESGNKYFAAGRWKEASIQYRNALKRDRKYGPAHYKLALVDLNTHDLGGAVTSLRYAIELLPPDSPDHWDAIVKLTEIYIQVAKDDKQFMGEAERFTQELLKRDPNSFDAHRLIGDLNFTRAGIAFKIKHDEEGRKFLDVATAEYRKADSVKPGQQGVTMQLARCLAAKGDFVPAEQLYRRVMAADKTYQGTYTELYKLYLFQNKPDQAEQILKLAFQNNGKQFGFLTLLAMHYYGQHRREDMVGVLNQIKSHAKEYDQAYLMVGDFYLRMGDGDSAIREYKDGIAKDSNKKLIYEKREVEVLMRQGKRAEAAVINDQILKAVPDDNDSRGLSATFLLDKGDISKALAELQQVVTRAPENPVAHYNLGRAHALRGEHEQARQQFQKAIELQPNYILARIALAQLQISRSEFDAATKTADAIVALDKGNVQARLIESAALMGQRRFAESQRLLEAMLKIIPDAPDILFQYGVVNLAQSKYKEAEEAFRRTYQLNPASLRGLTGMVETKIAQNRIDDGIKLLQVESDKFPNRVDLLMQLGNTAVRAGKYDFGIQTFDRAIAQLPKGSKQAGDFYLLVGETYRRKADPANAIQALQKARETMPDNIMVLSSLALVLDGANRKPEAKQVYDATLKLDPNNPVMLNNLAFLLAESDGDLNDALTKAQRAKQLMPNLNEISDTLGWIYLKKHLAPNAIEIFKDLVAKQPKQSTYRFHLGMAYSAQGDKSKALEQLREALKYNPAPDEKAKIQAMIVRLG